MNRSKKLSSLLLATLFSFTGAAMAGVAEQPSAGIGLSVIKTGVANGTPEAMLVDTGAWFTSRHLVQNAVLIKHPKGDVMIDTGLGKEIDQQFAENGFLDRQFFGYNELNPAADQMARAGYDKNKLKVIIPTHLHWDHASGLKDFPDASVWVQKAEYQEALDGEAPAFLASQFDGPISWNFIALQPEAHQGFNESLDVYGDGSIVLVSLAGHTSGQLGIFVTTTSGKQYFFTGDTTWTIKGIEDQVGRNAFLEWYVDVNWSEQANKEATVSINRILTSNPSIQIVPAHDEYVAATMPKFPEFQY